MTLGFSPCPNDTFIFYAMLHGKVDCKGIQFSPVIEDVETLNRRAVNGELDITKLSYAAYSYTRDHYSLLHSGSALGRNCGPLLISKRKIALDEIAGCSVAMPGRLTTANFLFNIFFKNHGDLWEMVFSEIEDAVLNETADLGVIIHENRFTYQKKGLQKVADLGEMWEAQTQSPIPLGGIFIRKSFPPDQSEIINKIIRSSVKYALTHFEEALKFVKEYSQEMDEEVIWQHIRLYVNEFTIDLGSEGLRAVELFYKYFRQPKNSLDPIPF
ncbi:MAG: 1,4-dihydroxy-6-naphthoate synthase [Chitinophagales bacterium]|nr:1,4-dihydroxy-6-naphthoate synthase [Chitinophagales bacterium]